MGKSFIGTFATVVHFFTGPRLQKGLNDVALFFPYKIENGRANQIALENTKCMLVNHKQLE